MPDYWVVHSIAVLVTQQEWVFFVLHAKLLLKIILATESVGVIFTLFGLHEFLKGFQVRDDLEFDIFRVFSFFEVTGVFI